MKRRDLENNPAYTKAATSRARGYVSRKADIDDLTAVPYKGRYGEGYTVDSPAFDSTQYCFRTYYVKK